MKDRISNIHPVSRESRRALLACGFWLRAGFIGASGVIAGLILLFDSEFAASTAFAVLAGGAALTALSWWRARATLGLLHTAESGAPRVSPTVNAASAKSALRTSSMQATAR